MGHCTTVKESSAWTWKVKFTEELQKKKSMEFVKQLATQKKGHLLLLREELDVEMKTYEQPVMMMVMMVQSVDGENTDLYHMLYITYDDVIIVDELSLSVSRCAMLCSQSTHPSSSRDYNLPSIYTLYYGNWYIHVIFQSSVMA